MFLMDYIILHRHFVYKIQFLNSILGKNIHNSLLNISASYLCKESGGEKTIKVIENSSPNNFFLVSSICFFHKDLKVYCLWKQKGKVL